MPGESPLIVLASTSRYRRELLGRLRLPFEVQAPQTDETAQPGEAPADLALRLARAKAVSVSARFPHAVVIGSDQTAALHGALIGKPHHHEAALAQLQQMQGQSVVFHTAVAVITQREAQLDSVPTVVTFRTLPRDRLERYLLADTPYDCTGSAKIESLGIALIEHVESSDPTALIGLPLIRLTSMLGAAGVDVLAGPVR